MNLSVLGMNSLLNFRLNGLESVSGAQYSSGNPENRLFPLFRACSATPDKKRVPRFLSGFGTMLPG
jgi:hypothetical protein